jgi:penicillin-binding protein 1A
MDSRRPAPSKDEPRTIRADLPPGRPGWIPWVIAAGAMLCVSLLAAAFCWRVFLADLPKIPDGPTLWSINRIPGMTFLDRTGLVIAVRGPRHGQRARLADLPPHVAHAFLAVEDHRFYEHGPVDLEGVARAVRVNWDAGGVVQGGSTLTQQLARTIFLSPDQTFKRKIQEAIIAWRLEQALSKDEVLELYLNRVFFGSNAYGIDAASQVYFGKPAVQLTLSEAALLAALPKAPSRLRPTRDMEAAVRRSHMVLRLMREHGWINAAAERAAAADRPTLAPPPPREGDYGYALDLAQAQAQALAGGQAPDLVVQIGIDPDIQAAAFKAVRDVMRQEGPRANAEQAALVALAPDGAIRALVGGVDHSFSPFDRAVQAQRQPGSAFKPFVYATALERGVRPWDVRQDAPVRIGRWSPKNFGGGYRGAVTIDEALVRSVNTVAVRLAQEAGAEKVGGLARRFGLTAIPPRPQLSIALGSYEVPLLDLTGAYQVFQQGGRRYPPYMIDRITASDGRLLFERRPSSALQVYDPGRTALMVAMLQGVVERGTGQRAGFSRAAAGKTGTSQDYRDAWFVGFTPDWVAGVWVGNDNNTPMRRVTGGDLPARIWRQFMIAAHQDIPPRPFPAGPPPARSIDSGLVPPVIEGIEDGAREAGAPSYGPRAAPATDRQLNDAESPAPGPGADGAFYNDLQDAFGEASAPPP